MNILDKIILNKEREVTERKSQFPTGLLEQSPLFNRTTISFKKELLREDRVGVIAEFKRKSPSKGVINDHVTVEETTSGYIKAGASALSILTDLEYFGGSSEDLTVARKVNECPVLRKDFIIDEYQIIEAKSIGADVILLLANVLSSKQIRQFAQFAKTLGLESLLEIRDKEELKSINEFIAAVGVNNRNLKDFQVNLSQSFDLVSLIPNDFVKISESGIGAAKTIHELKAVGYRGFLMGETFMKQPEPGKACADFIKEVNEYNL
ncbi:MAG: indole-3-glycerol phosphate synthase TrpC [Bacteroidota bacterium]